MMLTRVWAVRDPSPNSILGDIFFELGTGQHLVNYIMGSPRGAWVEERTALYTNAREAAADARARMARRDRGSGKRRAKPAKRKSRRPALAAQLVKLLK